MEKLSKNDLSKIKERFIDDEIKSKIEGLIQKRANKRPL
jgi:hypothetical protein